MTDRGAGLSPQVRKNLYDRHWHAKRANRVGAGFGLAIARGFLAAHGGRLARRVAPRERDDVHALRAEERPGELVDGATAPAARRRLGLGLPALLVRRDAVRLQLLPEVLARDAEQLRRVALAAGREPERALEILLLELLHRDAERTEARVARRRRRGRARDVRQGDARDRSRCRATSTTARSIACANSRTLPGNGYSMSAAQARGAIPGGTRPG